MAESICRVVRRSKVWLIWRRLGLDTDISNTLVEMIALDAGSLRGVGHHLTNALADAGDYNATVEYAEVFCSLAGDFLDLRRAPGHPSLDPDKAKSYPIGNALAGSVRAAGLNGIIYPSVRHAGGTCLAAIRPAAVQSVRQGAIYRMMWRGNPTPNIEGPL